MIDHLFLCIAHAFWMPSPAAAFSRLVDDPVSDGAAQRSSWPMLPMAERKEADGKSKL
jgi:hypothetical protein